MVTVSLSISLMLAMQEMTSATSGGVEISAYSRGSYGAFDSGSSLVVSTFKIISTMSGVGFSSFLPIPR